MSDGSSRSDLLAGRGRKFTRRWTPSPRLPLDGGLSPIGRRCSPRSASVARRRSARVSVGRSPRSRNVAELRGCPAHLVGATASAAVSRNRCGVMTSECPRRLPAGAQACSRPTRHPVQTPARRCHGGVASRRVDAVVSQPRSRPPSPQLDVAGTLGEGLPRRFRDTGSRSGARRQHVRGTLLRSAPFLDRGKRLGIHRGRVSASNHRGRAAASSHRGGSPRAPARRACRRVPACGPPPASGPRRARRARTPSGPAPDAQVPNARPGRQTPAGARPRCRRRAER